MSRRRVPERRDVLPDPIYNSVVVTKFINGIMLQGKKTIAEKVFYGAMKEVAEKTGEEPLKFSKRRWKMSRRNWKLNHAVSAVRLIKFRSKLRATAKIRWQFVGSYRFARQARRKNDAGKTGR